MDEKEMLKTYVCLILDRSGSMDNKVAATVSGFNEQVQQIKANAKDQEVYVSLITFNGDVYEHLVNESAEQLQETSADDYAPDGSTALRDAIGHAIDKFKETTDINDKNNAYLLIVMSDGVENSSTHYNQDALRESIQSLEQTGRWTFTYVGCDKSILEQVSRDYGIRASNMMAFQPTLRGTARAMRYSASGIGNYLRDRGKIGLSATGNFYSSDDQALDAEADTVTPLVTVSTTDSNKSNILGKGVAVTWDK